MRKWKLKKKRNDFIVVNIWWFFVCRCVCKRDVKKDMNLLNEDLFKFMF